MRKNEYKAIDEFVYEYCKGRESSWENPDLRQRYMGIEFCNEGIYYRMCREPYDLEKSPILKNGTASRIPASAASEKLRRRR